MNGLGERSGLLLLLCSHYMSPSELARLMSCGRGLRASCDQDQGLRALWLAALRRADCDEALRPPPTALPLLTDTLLRFRELECAVVRVFVLVNSSEAVGAHAFRRCCDALSARLDVHALRSLAHFSDASLLLLLAAAYQRVLRDPGAGAAVQSALQHVLYDVESRGDVDPSDCLMEIQYSDWGRHNPHGFRGRDVRRRLSLRPYLLLRDGVSAFGSQRFAHEGFAVLDAFLALSAGREGTPISCLEGAVVRRAHPSLG